MNTEYNTNTPGYVRIDRGGSPSGYAKFTIVFKPVPKPSMNDLFDPDPLRREEFDKAVKEAKEDKGTIV